VRKAESGKRGERSACVTPKSIELVFGKGELQLEKEEVKSCKAGGGGGGGFEKAGLRDRKDKKKNNGGGGKKLYDILGKSPHIIKGKDDVRDIFLNQMGVGEKGGSPGKEGEKNVGHLKQGKKHSSIPFAEREDPLVAFLGLGKEEAM